MEEANCLKYLKEKIVENEDFRVYITVSWPLNLNALRACVYIYTRQLSSFRAPTLWFIDLTRATCHIQHTFLSLCQFVLRENGQNTQIVRHFLMIRNWPLTFTKRAKLNTEKALLVLCCSGVKSIACVQID